MKKLFPTLLCFALLVSCTLASSAEVSEENSQGKSDNNTGENQSAEQSREKAPTAEDTLSSENDEASNKETVEHALSSNNLKATKESVEDTLLGNSKEATAENVEEDDENEENAKNDKENAESSKENEDVNEETNKEDMELKPSVNSNEETKRENEDKIKETHKGDMELKLSVNNNEKNKPQNEDKIKETDEEDKALKQRMGIVKEMHHNRHSSEERQASEEPEPEGPAPCTCGIFLSSQFKKGSKDQPKGLPVLEQEIDTPFMDNAIGNRQCMHRCLEVIIKHLPKSNEIICATVDKDHVHREKAFLFVKNHSHKWHETKMSAGREFCCKDNLPYKCNKSKRSIFSLFEFY